MREDIKIVLKCESDFPFDDFVPNSGFYNPQITVNRSTEDEEKG